MALKKRFYLAALAIFILALLSFIYRDTQSELPLLLNVLLGTVILYVLLSWLFLSEHSKANFGFAVFDRTDKVIGFISWISILGFGINMANRVDDSFESFWVLSGNIWAVDLLAAIIWASILYVFFTWIFNEWKKIQTLKNEKSKAELALLKNQINPHFFFNTLNNLYSLIKKDPDTAQEYVLKLSDMMRFTIYEGKEEAVSLEKEINYLVNFIELQTARYHNTVDIKFRRSIKNSNRTIPPLLFIVLVENAFKHGVEKLTKGAFIHINIHENNEQLIFKIKNNFDPDNYSKKNGIGLENLKDRLDLLYPNNYKLTSLIDDNTYSANLKITLK